MIASDPIRQFRLRKKDLEKNIRVADAQIEGLKIRIRRKIEQLEKSVDDSTLIRDYLRYKKCYINSLKATQTYKNQLVLELENLILE